MAKEYVEKLTLLMSQVKPKLPRGKSVEIRRFFGGAAAYVGGRIFMSLTKVGPAIKLPEADRERLFRSRRAKLRYFAKAPVKKQYALFSIGFPDDGDFAKTWIEKSVLFALSVDEE